MTRNAKTAARLCEGLNRSGQPCGSKTTHSSGRCFWHRHKRVSEPLLLAVISGFFTLLAATIVLLSVVLFRDSGPHVASLVPTEVLPGRLLTIFGNDLTDTNTGYVQVGNVRIAPVECELYTTNRIALFVPHGVTPGPSTVTIVAEGNAVSVPLEIIDGDSEHPNRFTVALVSIEDEGLDPSLLKRIDTAVQHKLAQTATGCDIWWKPVAISGGIEVLSARPTAVSAPMTVGLQLAKEADGYDLTLILLAGPGTTLPVGTYRGETNELRLQRHISSPADQLPELVSDHMIKFAARICDLYDYSRGEWEQAALRLARGDEYWQLHFAGVALLFQGERAQEAKTLLEAAKAMAPRSPHILSDLATATWRADKDPQAALVLYREAIEADPSFWWARIGEAEMLLHLGEIESAIIALETAASAGAHGFDYHQKCTRLYAIAGNLEDALRSANEALRAEPERLEAQMLVAGCLYMRKDYVAAVPLYRDILQRDACNRDALLMLGVINHEFGRTDRALDLWRAVVKCRPTDFEAWDNIASVLGERGDYEAAYDAWIECVFLEPDRPRPRIEAAAVATITLKLDLAFAHIAATVARFPEVAQDIVADERFKQLRADARWGDLFDKD